MSAAEQVFIRRGRRYIPAPPAAIAEAAAAYAEQRLNRDAPSLDSPKHASAYLVARLGALSREEFHVVYLDTRHRVIRAESLFQGTIDGASVHPRIVVTRALELGAAAVILSHNHPSGMAEPSSADELITLRLREALALVEVRVLDHVIVGGSTTCSLAERGLV